MGFLYKKTLFLTTALSLALSMLESQAADDNPFSDTPPTSPDAPSASAPPDKFKFPNPPPVPPKTDDEYEKCYGVSGKDENACGFATFDGTPNDSAGTAVPCDPGAWRWVPKGMCTSIVVGTRADGTILYGTLHPSLERGFPVKCTPYRGNVVQSQTYGL